jgi:hypothetical protein
MATARKNVGERARNAWEHAEEELRQWGLDLERLTARAEKAGAAARDGLREQAKSLRVRLDDARKKLGALQAGGKGASIEMERGFVKAWNELRVAFRAAVKKI